MYIFVISIVNGLLKQIYPFYIHQYSIPCLSHYSMNIPSFGGNCLKHLD